MIIKKIITTRSYQKKPSYDIIYEWEDVFQSILKIPFSFEKRYNYYFNRIPFLSYFFKLRNLAFSIEMVPNIRSKVFNIIPQIVDFYFKKGKEMDRFYHCYKNLPLIIFSSREVYDYIKNLYPNMNIAHLALSISDIYSITPSTKFEKYYDLVLMGRQNPILEDYLNRYVQENPDFIYVYRKQIGNDFCYYTSKGELVGKINSRKDYINLMRKAKVGLYATPGIDGGEKRTNGFSQVTPRFLEYIACGCHVVARYCNNSDTDYYELNSICPSIETYEDFENRMEYCLNNPVDMIFYSDYLSKHYTSVRAKQLQEIIKDI